MARNRPIEYDALRRNRGTAPTSEFVPQKWDVTIWRRQRLPYVWTVRTLVNGVPDMTPGGLVDLTYYAARMEVYSGENVGERTLLVTLTSVPGGGLVLGGPAGTLDVRPTEEMVTAESLLNARGWHELWLIDPSPLERCVAAGMFQLIDDLPTNPPR